MDQEYKADVCCPRNTSAAEVDNSVEKLTGNSTVRKAGSDEISLGDSQTNETNDHTNNAYQSNSTNPLKRKNVPVVSITNEEQHSKKSKLEESTPEINASDQEVRQENEEDEISNEHVNRIEESVDQNDYTGTLTDTVACEIGKCESENDDVELNVANQDQSHTASSTQDETDEQGPSASASTATVIKRPEAETLPKLYRLLCDDDILSDGLVAKNPNDRQLDVAEHVANGSSGGQSRYISTCSSLGAAQRFRGLKIRKHCRYKYGRKDIVEIDVGTLPEDVEIIDLRDQADREKYELCNKMEINQKFHKFASSHSEVLLVGRVPPKCLTLIPFTGTVPDSDESSDSDYY